MNKSFFGIFLLGLLLSMSCQKGEDVIKVECPSEERVIEIIKRFAPKAYVKVEKIEQFGEVPICEVSFRYGINYSIFYIDSKGKYVFPSVIDADSGENLVAKKISENQIIPKYILEMFEERTNYEFGKGDRFVILIFEPKNQTSEEVYKKLISWSKEKNFKIKIILLPYYANLEGYNIARSVICDKKTFDEVLKGYNTGKACDEAHKILDGNIEFVFEKMLLKSRPPMLISDTGKFWTGDITKEQFEELWK